MEEPREWQDGEGRGISSGPLPFCPSLVPAAVVGKFSAWLCAEPAESSLPYDSWGASSARTLSCWPKKVPQSQQPTHQFTQLTQTRQLADELVKGQAASAAAAAARLFLRFASGLRLLEVLRLFARLHSKPRSLLHAARLHVRE